MLGFVGWRTGGPFRGSFQRPRELGRMRVPRRVRCLHAREEEKGPTGRAVSVARLDFVGRGNGDGMGCRGTGGSGGTVAVECAGYELRRWLGRRAVGMLRWERAYCS